jgi:heme/copper-type cytochrome/quinol oxidase subunit 2
LTVKNHYASFRLLGIMKHRILLGLLTASTAFVADLSLAMACAVCVTGAANDPTAEAFNWSVLFMMATPYLVAGSIVGWLVYAYRRAAAKRDRAEGQQPKVHLVWNQKESGR